ncbi:hypothetical protein [Parabacteroides sp. FAFU027]|uniref:hypothetical protein n=1 Tax=Parabacteroides sp. FAFU027 TaxID=2922715 RepID=UPI001FAE8331|nr:hypothetical protein [Parabacteroides sp. FAFU027]
MMSFENFEYHESALPQDENEQKEFFENLEKEFCRELEGSDKARKYFEKYHPDSIPSFIKQYASQRMQLIKYQSMYVHVFQRREDHDLYIQQLAEKALDFILQKKLFNLQLKWRAEQIRIKEINMSYDFQFWGSHIRSCPFIPPIEKREIEIMKRFLLSPEQDNSLTAFRLLDWQDYDTVMEKDEEGDRSYMPDWYEWYDLHLGTIGLFYLSDIRGQKEEYYFQLYREDRRAKSADIIAQKVSDDPRERLYAFEKEVLAFALYIETDRHFIELFRYYGYYVKEGQRGFDQWRLNEAVDILALADRPVYLPGHLPWHESILEGLNRYLNARVVEILDFVCDNYVTLKELGISRGESAESLQEKYEADWLVDFCRKGILTGRKLKGEPEDFNF